MTDTTSSPQAGPRTSRLSAPVLPEILWRERLFDRLADACRYNRVIWLCAPGGAGKTTLAASFARHHDYPALWYQMDDTDSEPAAFFQYLAEAAEVAAPGARAALPQLTPEYLQGLPAFTRRFCEILFRCLPAPCLLILDNYQDLAADSPVHELLAQIAGQALTNQHIIVASRRPPPAQLARMQVNRQLEVLDWEQIRFTAEECGRCLALKGITDSRLAEQITRASDGWAAGLILMQKAGKPPPDEGQVHPDHQLVFDYFAAEALNPIPADDARLLMMAALLAGFSPRMLARLGRRDERAVDALLSGLHSQRFFIERHQRGESYYQFHPLFRNYLLNECRRHYTGRRLERLQRRAAHIALDAGQVETAARLMIDCQAWRPLLRMCLEHAPAMLQAGRHKTLLDWFGKLPEPLLKKNPRLRLWHGCAQLPYEPVAAADTFEGVYRTLKSGNDTTGRYLAWAFAVEAMVVYAWDNFNAAPFWLDELEDLLAESQYPSLEIECRVLLALVPMLIWAEGGIKRFPWLIERCHTLLHEVQEPSIKASLAAGILYFHSISADGQAAGRLIEAMHREIVHGPAVPTAKLYWYALCLHHYSAIGQQALAGQVMDEANRLLEESGLQVLRMALVAQAALMYLTRRDGPRASEILKKMKTLIVPQRRIEKLLYLHLSAIRHLQVDDDPRTALAMLEEGFKLALDTNAVQPQATYADTLCHIHLQLGQPERAQYYFDHEEKIAQRSGAPIHRYQLLLLRAATARYAGDTPLFKEALARALQFGKEHRIMYTFGQSRPTTQLFELALVHGIEEEYVKNIIQALQLKPDNAPPNWPWPIRVTTLGRFSIEIAGTPQKISARQKRVLEVLALLIAEHKKPISKEYIKRLVWPDADTDKAEQSFKSTITRLRNLLGADAVVRQGAAVELDKQNVWVDCWEVERLLKQLDASGPGIDDAPYRRIRDLYQGPWPQAEHYLWLSGYLEALHKKSRTAFTGQAQRLLNSGLTGEAIELARLGLEIDGTLEELYRVQISAYLKRGDATRARKTFHACSQALARKVKSLPSPETRKLLEEHRENRNQPRKHAE